MDKGEGEGGRAALGVEGQGLIEKKGPALGVEGPALVKEKQDHDQAGRGRVVCVLCSLVCLVLWTLLVLVWGPWLHQQLAQHYLGPGTGDKPLGHLHGLVARSDKDYQPLLASAGVLLPPVIHETLEEEDLKEGRIIIIGDVHGCLGELQRLLRRLDWRQDVDNVVLVGDLVEKGPCSVETLREARRVGLRSVRGNHDDHGLAAYEALLRGEKVKKKRQWAEDLSPDDAEHLFQLPFTLRIAPRGVVVVHAGLVPDVLLDRQHLNDLYYMREVVRDEQGRWSGIEAKHDDGSLGPAWASVWSGPLHVVFGHDHQRDLQRRDYATGIDTGCYRKKRLTAVVLPNRTEFARLSGGWRPADAPRGVTWDMLHAELVSQEADKHTWDLKCKDLHL